MIKAAITPGIQPIMVNMNTITMLPHPLSITANGGKMMDRMTLQMLIVQLVFLLQGQ
jgi:hypothetical protein